MKQQASDKLDTISWVETPEGILLPLSVAGPLPRMLAWLVDMLIRAAMFATIAGLLIWMEIGATGLILIGIFIIEWFYPVLFEMFMYGQTPGKKLFDMQVVQTDGRPVGWGSSLIRNLLRVVDFLPLMYGIGLLSMLLNKRFQRLGDIAASTMVCYLQKTDSSLHISDATAIPSSIALTADEQQAILGYAERYDNMTPERANELASLATPLLSEETLPAPQQLLGIANWLNGKQP